MIDVVLAPLWYYVVGALVTRCLLIASVVVIDVTALLLRWLLLRDSPVGCCYTRIVVTR